MARQNSLEVALKEELSDLLSAEKQLTKAYPKLIKSAENEMLKECLTQHFEETKGQIERLSSISDELGIKLSGKTCKAMEGLIEECKELLDEEFEDTKLADALLIGCIQRIEHYEMAAYGTAHAFATTLGEGKVAELLRQSLDEEKQSDEKLSKISEEEILSQLANTQDNEIDPEIGDDDNDEILGEEDDDDDLDVQEAQDDKKVSKNGSSRSSRKGSDESSKKSAKEQHQERSI
jgi:ferritin-like metal-binding protein YciE